MALTDLTKYDLLDLLAANFYPDEKKEEIVSSYMKAFADYLSDRVADRLKEEDGEKLAELLRDPYVTPEVIENFYKGRIPEYDILLLGGTLLFKKTFLLDFYKEMLKKTKEVEDASNVLWSDMVTAAEKHEWGTVLDYAKQIEEKFLPSPHPSKYLD